MSQIEHRTVESVIYRGSDGSAWLPPASAISERTLALLYRAAPETSRARPRRRPSRGRLAPRPWWYI